MTWGSGLVGDTFSGVVIGLSSMWRSTARVERTFPSRWAPGKGFGLIVQRVVMAVTGTESWTVLGDDGCVVAPVERYLAYLSALERSPNTVRAYASSLGLWFEFLDQVGVGWVDAGVAANARSLVAGTTYITIRPSFAKDASDRSRCGRTGGRLQRRVETPQQSRRHLLLLGLQRHADNRRG